MTPRPAASHDATRHQCGGPHGARHLTPTRHTREARPDTTRHTREARHPTPTRHTREGRPDTTRHTREARHPTPTRHTREARCRVRITPPARDGCSVAE